MEEISRSHLSKEEKMKRGGRKGELVRFEMGEHIISSRKETILSKGKKKEKKGIFFLIAQCSFHSTTTQLEALEKKLK